MEEWVALSEAERKAIPVFSAAVAKDPFFQPILSQEDAQHLRLELATRYSDLSEVESVYSLGSEDEEVDIEEEDDPDYEPEEEEEEEEEEDDENEESGLDEEVEEEPQEAQEVHEEDPVVTEDAHSGSDSRLESGDSDSDSDSERGEEVFPFTEDLLHLARYYVFGELLHDTSTSVVYGAVARWSGEHVCVKILNDPWGYSPSTVPSGLLALMACQGHPNIVPLVAWHRLPERESYVVVTKRMPEQSMADLMHKPDVVMDVAKTAAQVVAWMHRQRVIHRDLKPSNLMWSDERKTVVVIDFDISTFGATPRGHHSFPAGAEGYIAPEVKDAQECAQVRRETLYNEWKQQQQQQEDGSADFVLDKTAATLGPDEGYGQAVDLWALGVLVAQLMLGVHEDELSQDGPVSAHTLKQRLLEEPLPAPYPEAFVDVVANRLLVVDPHERATAIEVAQRLDALAARRPANVSENLTN